MKNHHRIQPGTDGFTDTISVQATTVQCSPQEIRDTIPQKNAETPKEVPLVMIGGLTQPRQGTRSTKHTIITKRYDSMTPVPQTK